MHHHTGVPIVHPTIEAIENTIEESPHKYNHVYHVLDAADFPMSLISGLQRSLELMPQRSQNRRARHKTHYRGRAADMSFIITRADLLLSEKKKVDSLMPYLVEVLREALGRRSRDLRLGNVRCVSAKRGWWTKEVKEEIWKRGGGGWMVGKVNVGKSNLFEVVFPKGRSESMDIQTVRNRARQGTLDVLDDMDTKNALEAQQCSKTEGTEQENIPQKDEIFFDEDSLLPPPQPETAYPVMPLVSALPGTTASPIRVPFGNGRGELIDLPGLSRGNLADYVLEEHRPSLIMKSRIKPEQHVVKPKQSLLLGGLIRITPVTPDMVFLAYPFVPLEPHLSATEKAIDIQTQSKESGVRSIAAPGTGESIKSAGIFGLNWDVTKARSGPLTAKDAVGMKAENLPYKVLSTDILIEGVGWVELVAQVRKRALEDARNGAQSDWPEVEIFSPEGKFIGARRPMGAWVRSELGKKERTKRPRRSVKGEKKATKKAMRVAATPLA